MGELESKEKTERTPEDYMQMVLELARRGEGKVSPNPMVGCVVVKEGRVIATAQCPAALYRGSHRRRALCEFGTLLSLWQDTALYRNYSGKKD